MSFKHLLLFILFNVFIQLPVFSANIIEINDQRREYLFSFRDLDYLEDQNYSVDQIIGGELEKEFKVNKIFAPHNYKKDKAYWVRIKIKGNPNSSKTWLLEFFDQTTDYIEAYIPDGKGGFIQKITGDSFPFDKRLYSHKNFEFHVPNNSEQTESYYFKIKSSNHINIIIVLRSWDYFIYYALNEYFIYGIFYGMILIITIYNLLMFLAIKEFQYISYVLYVLSVGFYFMSLDGIAYQYLWPNHSEWNKIAYGVGLFSLIFWSLMFTKNFLHLNTKFPLLNSIINYTLVVRALIFLIALFFYPPLFEHRWIDVFPLSLAFYSGVISYLKGYKPARFFILAYGFLFFGFIVRIIINLDLAFIPASIFGHYSLNLSFGFEMWLLSFALGDKVRIIKNIKDKAQRRIIKQHEVNQKLKDKVNKELEKEVVKRTKEINDQKRIIETQNQELQKVNDVLRQQADEIKKMNSILDKDNYKLKNTIKEEMLARAASKNMSYSEFKIIFPNELSCFRYLEQEKWKNGFNCKKCDNNKFIAGKGKFDRRCTRCGYNESPTAFTIFHGIKFSIEKAFYILHLVITERNDLTIDEISQTLELRRNTCWNFKNKISKVIKKYGKDKEYFEHWEKVIFESEEGVKKVE